MQEIKNELMELGFNIDSRGIIFWIDAIRIIQENPLIWNIMDIYEIIANKYNLTISQVEKNLRDARIPATKNIQEKYCYYKRIKNQTFLNLIRFKLI